MAEEKKLEQRLVHEVGKSGGLALKFVSPSYAGMPDRLVLIGCGKIGFVEVKAKGKTPRPIQKRRHDQLAKLGFKVYVLDDKKQIGGIIDDIRTT